MEGSAFSFFFLSFIQPRFKLENLISANSFYSGKRNVPPLRNQFQIYRQSFFLFTFSLKFHSGPKTFFFFNHARCCRRSRGKSTEGLFFPPPTLPTSSSSSSSSSVHTCLSRKLEKRARASVATSIQKASRVFFQRKYDRG